MNHFRQKRLEKACLLELGKLLRPVPTVAESSRKISRKNVVEVVKSYSNESILTAAKEPLAEKPYGEVFQPQFRHINPGVLKPAAEMWRLMEKNEISNDSDHEMLFPPPHPLSTNWIN